MDHKKEFCKVVGQLAGKYGRHEIFTDFCELAALSLRQTFERSEKNERAYLDLINRYEPDEQPRFAELLALTVEALTEQPRDFLGECFHELELYNQYKGQYFTPFDISRMMARISLAGLEEKIRQRGYLELNEPTCGSGGMVIAAAEEFKARGLNPVNTLFAVAQDIDRKCCNMAYIQLSLLAIPAAVIWGNTLLVECREQWLSAGYFLGPWADRFRWRRLIRAVSNLAPDKPPAPKPAPAAPAAPPPLDGPAGQLLFNF
ncbi:N-6 DNA methylase [uncultured Victivallis sp.]|uniref:N-6 DNA methylase n=1 Tax=uncultured Victivallis sp. TaxID=354118 RepID=UPI0025921C64|nr:N-6 DNA methylase [uncultured Victivallis sp.]